MTRIIVLIALASFMSACSAGGDAKFSPDPTISPPQSPAGGEIEEPGPAPEETGGTGPGETGGGETTPNNAGVNEQETNDCFAEGFCHRDCTSGAECPAGFSCIMNACTFDCQTAAECGKGGICSDVGLCETATGERMAVCKLDAECGEGRFCNGSGECEKKLTILGCQGDIDCPAGKYCSELSECLLFVNAAAGCATDSECPASYYCGEDGQCRQDCRSDYQCANARACSQEGKCVDVHEPAKITMFNFNAAGAEGDPAGPVSFTSASFRIDSAAIAITGRNQVLVSPRFRLTGNIAF